MRQRHLDTVTGVGGTYKTPLTESHHIKGGWGDSASGGYFAICLHPP